MSKPLSVLVLAGCLFAQNEVQPPPPPQDVTPAAVDPTFVHEFGATGAPGSFRVKFDPRGAGIVFVQMKDHFVDLAAKARADKTIDDFKLLVWSGDDHAVRLAAGAGEFARLAVHTWQHAIVDGAVQFTLDSGKGLKLTKTFKHQPDKRSLVLELRLDNTTSEAAGAANFDLLLPALENEVESSLFGNPARSIATNAAGANRASLVPDAAHPAQPLLKVDGLDFGMAGSTNRFFGGFLYPLDDLARRCVFDVVQETLLPHDPKHAAQPRLVASLQLPIPPQARATTATFGIYLGPKSYHVFEDVGLRAVLDPIMDFDLEPPCCGSIVIPGGRQMATLLLHLLGFFQGLCHNWGVAIMLLTILVRGCLAPLNFKMQKSMRAYSQRMAVLKPKMDKLKEQYVDDPKGYQQAMIQFQRDNKLMPPLGGCLPIFLTMPIYLGLFTALRTAYDLRHQPFCLWITDLSQPDALFALGFWPDWFNLLPLVWMGLMVHLQLKTPLPTDPQQRQTMMIMRYMPLVFGVLLYNYASGLMVYMVTSMVWTLIESAITRKILGPIDPNVQAMAPTPMM